MVQQYLRTVKVAIDGGKTFTYDGTIPDDIADGQGQGPGFRIRFDVHQRDSSTPNYANIYIYNLSDASQQPALIRGKTVTLSAGYGGNLQQIFKGQVIQARANLRENPMEPDTALAILATDSGLARNNAVVNKTLAAGHTHKDRAQVALDALKAMGVQQGYIAADALSKVKFPRGFACFGMAKDLLRQTCAATKTSFSIQNGKAYIVENSKPTPGGTTILRGDTGLIGLPVQTIQGIEGQTLLNPQLHVYSLVQIESRLIQQSSISPAYGSANQNYYLDSERLAADGIYKLYVVEHYGDTRGNDFYTSFIGVRNGALPNPALATRLVPEASN